MRVIITIILNAFINFLIFSVALGATIEYPIEGQQVDAGSWITVVVKPAPGEQWENFIVGFKPFEYDSVNKEYKLSIQVPNDVLGYRDDLRVYGLDKSGNEVELKRGVFVKLPPNVVLKSILPNKDYMLLYKLPAGSDPGDVKRIESRQLTVKGVYSDGVKRNITASAHGTTYTSSNENIVTVSPEGKVTAQGLGEAKIIVKNGTYSAKVEIDVKPYRQPER